MNHTQEHCRQTRKTVIELTERLEALEDWLNIHYERIPAKDQGQSFPAEFTYRKKPRRFFPRGRQAKDANAPAIPHRQSPKHNR